MCCMVHVCAGLCGGCILYEIMCVEISMLGPKKLVVHIFLNTFQSQVDLGGVEKKDTGYSKRYFKNGPKVLDQSLQMSPRTGSAIAKTSFDGARERERKKSPSGAPILTP